MIRKPISPLWHFGLGVLSVVILLGAYTYLAHDMHVENPDDTTIPTWSQIKEGVTKAVQLDDEERWILIDGWATMKRLFLGMLVGVTGGLVIGLLMGCVPAIEALCYPPMAFFAKVPPTAALAVFFVLVGTDLNFYIGMIAFGVLPTLAQATYLAVKDVSEELLDKASTLGASNMELVWNVICRQVLPNILDATRLQIGPAIVYLISAEMITGDVGFGYRIKLQMKLLNMSVIYPYLMTLGLFGFGLDYGMRLLQKWTCPWFVATR